MTEERNLALGRRSVAALVEILESYSWAQLKQLLFEHSLDQRFSGTPRLTALGNVFYQLIEDAADVSEQIAARDILEEIAQEEWKVFSERLEWDPDAVWSLKYESLRKALRADGLDLVEGRVTRFLSSSVSPDAEQGLLERRLDQWKFEVPQRHLQQVIDNAARGNWESANGQVRSFMESLCDAMAAIIYQGTGTPPTRGDARMYLANESFFSPEESDLLKAFFQVLHGSGGHAGASDEDDCHRRRLIALALANYYLDRLEDWGQ